MSGGRANTGKGLAGMIWRHRGSSVSLLQGPQRDLEDFLDQVVSEDLEDSLWYQCIEDYTMQCNQPSIMQ